VVFLTRRKLAQQPPSLLYISEQKEPLNESELHLKNYEKINENEKRL
jgi:hypothetical protein